MITLIGEYLAEVGLSFIFYGPVKACKSCRFKASCVESLEKGRKYIITEVKNITQKCPIHDGGIVKAVEIDFADIEGFLDSRNVFEGSNISYNPPKCDFDCIHNHLCFPEGLFEGDKCITIKNLGKNEVDCVKGLTLTKVSLRLHL